MARYGLMAGALSSGLEQALAGANQGLLGGEEIRHRRAQEALQQQYYAMSQQQLMNQLAQQAFQNWAAQQHLGLARQSEGRLAAGQQFKQGIDLSAEERAREMAPVESRLKSAQAGYYEERPDIQREAERGRSARFQQQHDIALARLNDLQRRTTAYIARQGQMKANPALMMKARSIQSRLHDVRQQLGIAARAADSGMPLPKGAKSYQELMVIQAELEGEWDALVGGDVEGGGGGREDIGAPAFPMTFNRALKEFGLHGGR